ncbi:MAG: hypothetical protein KAS72_05900 [Phycisphaerales bacterium]|nr:hypothetical protein [Phycisphaerales bacterium]
MGFIVRSAYLIAVLVAGMVGALAATANAQTTLAESLRREVRLFDFDSERDWNLDPVPHRWIRIDSWDGFPAYNKAAFDDSAAMSGSWSVKLPTRGGSTGLRLPGGIIPAIPGSDYVIAAWVRTIGLTHARARLSAVFHDIHDQPIESSRVTTELIDTAGLWEQRYVKLHGEQQDVAWLTIELTLLQPSEYAARPPHEHEARLEDVNAAAWFDDIAIYKAPRLRMWTNSTTNVIVAPERPIIRMLVNDMASEKLSGKLTVYDLAGDQVDQLIFPLARSGREFSWQPKVTKYGWYRSVLELDNSLQIVGGTSLTWTWLPPRSGQGREELRRFGIIAEDVPLEELASLPELLDCLGVGAVWVSVWDRNMTKDAVPNFLSSRETVLDELLLRRYIVTLVLKHVPRELARREQLDDASVLDAVRLGQDVYGPYLDPMLVKFGQQIQRWQLGATGCDEAFFEEDLAMIAQSLVSSMERYIPGPIPAMPWGLEQSPRPEVGASSSWTISVPWSVSLDALANHTLAWREMEDVTLVLQSADPQRFSTRAAVSALAKRAIIAWSVEVPRLAIRRPWETTGGFRRQEVPTPEFAVWHHITRRLGGRRIVSSLPVVRGVRAFLLTDVGNPHAGGAIVAWNESAAPEDAVIRMHLGPGDVTVVDLFGNETLATIRDEIHVIPLSDEPVFIEDVDISLALFRAGFALEPGFVTSTFDLHEHVIEIENPWDVSISGELKIVEPVGWEFKPSHHRFSIPSGGRVRLPIAFTFPSSESAGRHQFAVDVTLFADRPSRLRIAQDIEVGLKSVVLTPSFEVQGDDVIVMLQVTNTSFQANSYRVFVSDSVIGRHQRPIGELLPSETRLVYFKFPGAAEALSGRRLRVGLMEIDGPGRLNKHVRIP